MRTVKAVGVLLVWLLVAALVFYALATGSTGLGLAAVAVVPMLAAIIITVKIMSSNGDHS